jgi:modulator of FtsH protease HflC
MVRLSITVIVILVLLVQSTFIVSEGEQGLVLQFGKIERVVLEPGLYFKYPFIQDFVPLNKRILGAESHPSEYITLDKKRLMVDTVSRWKIEDPKEFYIAVRNERDAAISRLNETIIAGLRQEVANHKFKDFIREKREGIMKQVTEMTAQKAKEWGISVVDVRIKRVDLPEEVQKSVFARMNAEREKKAKGYRAEGEEQAREIRANANKEVKIILAEAYGKSETLRGEGDAEATAVYAAAYGKDEEFYSFTRHLEVYKKVFAADTTWLLKPGSDLLRFFDSSKGQPK